jgi:hypothetical protein
MASRRWASEVALTASGVTAVLVSGAGVSTMTSGVGWPGAAHAARIIDSSDTISQFFFITKFLLTLLSHGDTQSTDKTSEISTK